MAETLTIGADSLDGFVRNGQKKYVIPISYPEYGFMQVQRHTSCDTIRVMDVRIDFISNGLKTVVCIAGRLSKTAVAQLKNACDPIENPAVIDLSNLLFADDAGINAIREILDTGAQVRGASPFVQLLLDNASRSETDGEESKLS